MATELLQDLEGLSMNAHLEQAYLQADISDFEEVEEIVKSNLRMISLINDDENAQDGFPEHHDGCDDLLGMLNLQSSDLEEKDTTESNEKSVDKEDRQNESSSNCDIAVKSPEMPQASKDLLDDITLVINNDKNFTDDHHLVNSKAEGLERDRKELPESDQSPGKLDATLRLMNKELIKAASTKIPFNAECFVEDLDNHSLDHEKGNSDPTGNFSAKDVYFEQSLQYLLNGGSSEVVTTPQKQNVHQENLLEAPQSLDSLSENSVVERSCNLLPWQSFRDVNGTVKATVESRSAQEPYDDHDITVDGEGEDNHDDGSLGLCPLSYDENLTCSFYELLQLHNDDNSELIEHGQRGRPPRQKVTRQAVPCKIEPKVSQASLQPAFLPPQMLSSAFQNYQPGLCSVVSSQLQPCLGQEMVRFPVLLHSKTNSSGQVYLEVCPDITQLTATSQASILSSIPPPDGNSCSSKGNSEETCLSSKIDVAPQQANLRPSTDTLSHFADESPRVGQNQLSLEIDGPIRRQTALSQGRNGSSRNDPYFRMAMGNSGQVGSAAHAVGSLLEEPYRMQNVQGNPSFAVSSHNFVPSSFAGSPNLIRAQDASSFGGSVQNGMPYFSTSMEGSLYQNNQNVLASSALMSYGMHDQPSQYLLPTNNQYAPGNSASSTNSHIHQYGYDVSGEPMGNWESQPNTNIQASPMSHCLANNNNPSRHTVTGGAAPYARISSPGLPNIPVDPRSRRVQILMTMGGHGQRQVKVDSSSSDIHSATTSQNVALFPTSNNEYNNSMIQLSPPAELKKPQFVTEHNINPIVTAHVLSSGAAPEGTLTPATAHVPSSGATADGSLIEKSVIHSKRAPSHSSTRSSKGPDLPVPTERSKTRVEQWLNNNVMFRPDLDSGTFDPSDYSLLHASISHATHQCPEAVGSERALSKQSYEYVGIFEGKRIMVIPPQTSSKQKPNKRTSTGHHHGKGSPLTQAGQNRHSMISEASAIIESSLSSGYTNSSKDKYTESKQEAFNEGQKPPGRMPVAMNTLDHLDENQQADWAIAEDMKRLEQTSIEKRLAGISSSSSGHVLSELEQYLRSDMKSPSTSGNLPGSGLRLEAVVSGSSKQSSFDTSKYITPSEIESLEKKKTQNGKNSLDNYLEQVKYVSNDSMHAEQNPSDQGDGKQLKNIPLNDFAEVIGLQRELNQQPSRRENCHAQFKNSQKAVKRRPADHAEETGHHMGQIVEVGGQNAVMGEQNIAFHGQNVVIGGQRVVLGEQTRMGGVQQALLSMQNVAMGGESYAEGEQNATVYGQNTAVGGQNATVYGQNTAVGGQNATVYGQNTAVGGQNATVYGQNTAVGGQNAMVYGQNTAVGGQNATAYGQNTAVGGKNTKVAQKNVTNVMQNNNIPEMLAQVSSLAQVGQNKSVECLPSKTPNFGDQHFMVFSKPGGIHHTVIGPPTTQPDFFMKNGLSQYAKFSVSSTAQPAPHQTNPVYESPSFQAFSVEPAASLTLNSGRMHSDSQLPNFTDSYETEMRSTPSSVEIIKDSRPGLNNEFFTVSDPNRNELVPASSVSSTQQVMQSAAAKISIAVASLPHSSSQSSLTHSTATSASQMSNTYFKKPQNPSCFSGSMTACRPGVTSYPSVGGDSDVSMSSDTSIPTSMAVPDRGMDSSVQTQQQLVPTQQQYEQYSVQFQQMSAQQLGQNMLQSTQVGQKLLQNIQQQVGQNMLQSTQVGQKMLQNIQQQVGQNMLQSTQVGQNMLQSTQVGQNMLQSTQQVQNHKQEQPLNQQYQHLQMGQNLHQQQLLLQQQKHLQLEQVQKQMQNQQQCLLMQNQQQIGNQDYYQLQNQHHQMQNQQNLQFPTKQQMYSQQQQQEIQNNQQDSEENQQKQLQHVRNQQQFEESLLQQSNQQQQVYQMQIQKQQQIQKQGQHLQQQMADQQQVQNHQHLHLQNQQQVQIQQLQMQPGEMSHIHLLQNQQQMQQYKLLLNQQHFQQMQAQQLQQQQIQQLQQQKQTESQQLQQQQRLFQEQYSEQSPAFTNTCIPRRTTGSRAGSTCSEPQPYRILPGTKFETRSMSQISDSVYSRQLGNLSPATESTHDLQDSIADNDLALFPLSCQQLTGNSNQAKHGENNVNHIHKDNMSGQNQQEGLHNFNQPASGNQTVNTATSIQQPPPGNIEIAEQDQNLKSATEAQLQKYLKEGFPSLHSVEYCQDRYTMSSFSPVNIPSLPQGKPQQSLVKSGHGIDSGDGSSDKSNRVQSAERSREQADSDLSVFSLGSGGDLLSFQQDNDGETPLHLLSELPKEGINSLPSMPGFYEALNLQNKNQETALDIAVKNENLDAVKFLVSHGADVNIFCLSSQKGTGSKAVHRNETVQQTALHEAVELGNKEIVKVLLTSQNVKVDARRPDSGLTPLMLALQLHRQSDRKEIISELINHQASLRLHDTIQGKTPLMFAIQSRDVSLVEGILQQVGAEEARALVSERAKKDMTCLHFAAELRLDSLLKKRLLRCIIVAGGDPSAKNSEGETPRDWAKTDINEVLQNLARLFSQ